MRRSWLALVLLVFSACGSDAPQAPSASIVETFTGSLATGTEYKAITVGPGGAGVWQADLTWNNAAGAVALEIFTTGGTFVTRGELTAPTASARSVAWTGQAGDSYRIDMYIQVPGVAENYQLKVTRPRS